MSAAAGSPPHSPRVGLLVTCLVDLWRPSVGFAAIKLLEAAGCSVEVPIAQTCCGQPAYNSGDRANAQAIARQVIAAFERFDAVVAPSASCAGMIKIHYLKLLRDDPEWGQRAASLSAKTHELIAYLVRERELSAVPGRFNGRATYHDSCSALRELAIEAEPRALLAGLEELKLVECTDREVCCGFGGAFAVKHPDISGAMVDVKARRLAETGADCVLSGDLGCLLNIAGRLTREGSNIEVRHIAEVLAGVEAPAIGKSR